jgi:hypothetical protein
MKFLLAPALAAALLALASPSVRATPLDDRVAELKHAVEKEAADRVNAPNNPNGFVNPGMSPAFIDATIDQVISQMENPAYGTNMDAQLAQITSMYTSTEVQEATTNLLNEIKKERKEKTDAEIAGLKALMTRAGQVITQAKKPEDLDDLIAEMSKHGNNPYGGNPALQGNQELSRQFSSAFEFVKKWQDYLAHLANGQTDQARNDLQMLSNNNYGEGLLPRSKLLEMESPDRLLAQTGKPAPASSTPVMQAQGLLDGMKTLDDIKPTLQKLEPLRQSDMQELQNVYNQLSQMQATYEDLKAGLPPQSNVNYGYNQSGITVPPVIRAQMLLLTLQSRFDSFKGPPPAPDEKPVDFVDRVIADAMSRQDWELLRQADSARGSLTKNLGLGYAASFSGGVESIIAAAHQEAAGQFALAVQSYQTALKSDDAAIPAKIIGDKLAAIQRDHPKEFADGMQLTVSPPAPHYYQGPGQPYRSNPYLPPGVVNPMTPAPIPASLLSPATNTAPASAAPPAK